MSEKPPAPKRAFEIHIKVGGNTKDDALDLLTEFHQSILDGAKGCTHGGPSAGGFFDIRIDESMTHERYCKELSEHLEKHQPPTV